MSKGIKKEKKDRVKGKKSKNILFKLISVIQIIISIFLIGLVVVIDVLPFKYLGLLFVGILLFDLFMFLILFKSKLKRGIKKFFAIISVIVSVLFVILSFYLYKTYGVITEMIESDYEIYNYSVMVLSNSKYDGISDLKNKKIGYYETKGEENKLSLDKLSNVVSFVDEKYNNLNSLATDLLDKEVSAIVLEDSYKKTLIDSDDDNEYNELKDFKDKTKVIYTFEVKIKALDTSKDVDVTEEVFNIYISGIDTYGKISSVSRSDVNMVVSVNPNTRQILLTSIPRDYYVELDGTNGSMDKLTHAGIYGTDCSIKTIENLLDIDINYYFKVNFTSLIDIVNALGGVNVYTKESFTTWNGYKFTKGYNKVDGKAALAFVRERHAFAIGDKQRGINQQALINAMINKCMSKEIITKYTSLLNSVKGSIITNMPTKTMLSLVKLQLKENKPWTVTSVSLDGTSSYEYTYSYSGGTLYVMIPSEDSVDNAKTLINKVLEGEVLESSYSDLEGEVHAVSKTTVKKNNSSSTVKKQENKEEEEQEVKEEVKEEIKDEENKEDETLNEDVVEDNSSNDNITDIPSTDDENTLDSENNTENKPPKDENTDEEVVPNPPVEENDSSDSNVPTQEPIEDLEN